LATDQKLQELYDLGIDPFGQKFDRTSMATPLHEDWDQSNGSIPKSYSSCNFWRRTCIWSFISSDITFSPLCRTSMATPLHEDWDQFSKEELHEKEEESHVSIAGRSPRSAEFQIAN
jgi:lysyl-tRNA synthetase class II